MGLLKALFIFGTGVYIGVYCKQNYDIPEIPEPKELVSRAKQWLDDLDRQYKKKDD